MRPVRQVKNVQFVSFVRDERYFVLFLVAFLFDLVYVGYYNNFNNRGLWSEK